MRIRRIGVTAVVATLLVVPVAHAQEEEGQQGQQERPAAAEQEAQEEAGTRVLTITRVRIPFQDRPTVIPFMRRYVFPATQLNPAVRNFRVAFHNWGSDAGEVLIMAEFDDLAAVGAECGPPCEEYDAANGPPAEGSPERAEFEEAQRLFQTHFSDHEDEIYVMPMDWAKVEGTMVGEVGLPEAEVASGGDGS